MIRHYVFPVTLLRSGIAIAALLLGAALYAQGPPAGGAQQGARGGGFGIAQPPVELDFSDHTGFVQIFDGKTLDGWDGAPGIWSVEDGAIVATSTEENSSGTTFLIYRGGEVGDFEVKLEVRLDGGNTGIQYRSRVAPYPNFGARGGPGGAPGGGRGDQPAAEGRGVRGDAPAGGPGGSPGGLFNPERVRWHVAGYQADFTGRGTGQLFEGGGPPYRGITTQVGQIVSLGPDGPRLIGNLSGAEEVSSQLDTSEWCQYHVIARGFTYFHIVNGELLSVTIDDNPEMRQERGLLALQIEARGAAKAMFRNIWLNTD